VDRGPGSKDSLAIGVVTGLASEAAVVSAMLGENDASVRLVCAGASVHRAAALTRQLVETGVDALLSFGIAGALAPEVDCGDLIVSDRVRGQDGEDFGCDRQWREALVLKLGEAAIHPRVGGLLASARTLREASEKSAAYRDSGCLVVDMESGAVAAIAREQGLPFLAVRAVADRAADSLPALVETAVKPNGRPAVGRAVAALLRRPGDIPATLRLARQSELALARLRMLEAVKGALFGGGF
jgi:adenosylhomocysteine nucleosidase